MDVIVMESDAFYKLVEECVQKLAPNEEEWPWMTEEEVMGKLNVTSKTTMWQIRTEGKITYTQPKKS